MNALQPAEAPPKHAMSRLVTFTTVGSGLQPAEAPPKHAMACCHGDTHSGQPLAID